MTIAYSLPTVPFFKPALGDAEIEAVVDVMRSGWLTTGPGVRAFEKAFSEMLGPGIEAVAINSATAGLHLALEACGVGPGHEVLVPTLTFTATAEVVHHLGAKAILVDVDPLTLTIDLDAASRVVTKRTRAIMPVHFAGRGCPMGRVWDFARRHDLHVVEDAAHALPTRSEGLLIGAGQSAACVFSFYANKTLTTGEGGMLTTRDAAIAARARTMRCHGLDRDAFDRFRRNGAAWSYDVIEPGFKYNLTDIAAAIGIVQLKRAFALQAARQRVAETYLACLSDLPLDLPAPAEPDDLHAWHIFPVRIRESAGIDRDAVIDALAMRGIGSSVHYRPLHQMTHWSQSGAVGGRTFPAADRYFSGALSLPLYPDMSTFDTARVSDALHSILQ